MCRLVLSAGISDVQPPAAANGTASPPAESPQSANMAANNGTAAPHKIAPTTWIAAPEGTATTHGNAVAHGIRGAHAFAATSGTVAPRIQEVTATGGVAPTDSIATAHGTAATQNRHMSCIAATAGDRRNTWGRRTPWDHKHKLFRSSSECGAPLVESTQAKPKRKRR